MVVKNKTIGSKIRDHFYTRQVLHRIYFWFPLIHLTIVPKFQSWQCILRLPATLPTELYILLVFEAKANTRTSSSSVVSRVNEDDSQLSWKMFRAIASSIVAIAKSSRTRWSRNLSVRSCLTRDLPWIYGDIEPPPFIAKIRAGSRVDPLWQMPTTLINS